MPTTTNRNRGDCRDPCAGFRRAACAGFRRAAWTLALALGSLAAAGCSDRVLDTGLVSLDYLTGNDPGAEAAAELPPSPIRRMTGDSRTWPNLATVPPRPTGVPTPAARRQAMDKLEQDRTDANGLREALDTMGVPPPLPDPGRPPVSGG